MSFYEEIKKRAEELGGTALWEDRVVGHGTSERVLTVYPPPVIVTDKKKKTGNRIMTKEQMVNYLNGDFDKVFQEK